MTIFDTENRTRIVLRDIQTDVKIGIYDAEKLGAQTIHVDVDLWTAQNNPHATRADFLDYDRIIHVVRDVWPTRPHIELLETLVEELVSFALEDERVDAARVRISKSAIKNVHRAGVEVFRMKTPK